VEWELRHQHLPGGSGRAHLAAGGGLGRPGGMRASPPLRGGTRRWGPLPWGQLGGPRVGVRRAQYAVDASSLGGGTVPRKRQRGGLELLHLRVELQPWRSTSRGRQ
jgi:hypothetical protein